jgi:translation initiation factor 6 (eIF-6)
MFGKNGNRGTFSHPETFSKSRNRLQSLLQVYRGIVAGRKSGWINFITFAAQIDF